jgi:RNA polymerase sigma factor (sigma-70 family)
MYSINNFGALIEGVAKSDRNACEIISEHISILVEQWGRKNKIELCWNSMGNEVVPVDKLLSRVRKDVIVAIQINPGRFCSFADYKSKVVEIVEVIVDKGFRDFNTMLIQGNNISWSLLDNKLKVLSAKWFSDRKSFFTGDASDVYYSAVAVLYEKISSEEKYFNNSYGLKSYFFCILENKALENNRKQSGFRSLNQIVPVAEYTTDFSDDNEEIILQIRNKLNRLSETEQYIIVQHFWNEKKLNEIADELSISFENCRVMKHRAIKKIAGFLNIKH